ncbi:L-lactate permease [Staphylococcus simulans]|uniref:L-lactate permease n=1 Tax=Staphylococcus simulans TaxID=1286 RepID=UPI000D1F16BB|nr:L-lactate permease [Staphylococcus simulans]MDY5061153.1 L-lactate permease [Staphylococcus simulans]PTJ19594.1 L-lactate permease [Staphylococcus simulans]
MLVSSFDPFHNLLISSLVAGIPIILFLLCLTIFKMKGIYAALTTLIITMVVAVFIFKLPGAMATGAVIEGFFQGWFPIGYIVIMAVWLYKLSTKTGQFSMIQDSIATISQDQRVQLLLIGFCFNAFLEGVAGFGVPIAICAILLIYLGFKPLQAAMLCLVANSAAGAFGAIGLPVAVIDTLNLHGGITAHEVSTYSTLTLVFINFFVPFLIVFIIDGFKGIKETLPFILMVSVVYSGFQGVLTFFQGPELADVLPPLAAMGALAIMSRKMQPKHIFRIDENVKPPVTKKLNFKQIMYAWSPFYILTILIMFWSMPFFKGLFLPGKPLNFLAAKFTVPGTYSEVTKKAIVLNLNILGYTGTAILLTIIITVLLSKTTGFKDAFALLGETFKELWISVVTICFILAVSKLTTYGGLSAAMGQGISKAGGIFPLFSPVLGWIGVFMTGSVVNNNSLFTPIQASVASQIGVSGGLLVAANTVGGVAAKIISPQSIAIATAAVKQVGKESELLKMSLRYSVGMLIFICIWTLILSLIL